MLVPVGWLREYVDFSLPIVELADRLTMAGMEVEEIRESGGEQIYVTYVTPNRSDLLSMVGVARETAALLGTLLKEPRVLLSEGDADAGTLARVDIESPVNCPRYSARVITGITITDSPQWMQQKLIAAGMRPINNVVDATNFVLLELGQPLHAFDYDLLADHHIIVRQARAGEKIVTIDGEERALDEEMLVIADPKHAVAVAGVMGGSDSEVNPGTKNVLLESAHFNRLSIRRTARKLAMSTEASYRFERFVDPELTIKALDRVTQLIHETGGGTIARGVIDAYPRKIEPVTLTLRPDRTRKMLGMDVSDSQIGDYIGRLGMDVSRNGDIRVTVPTFRSDITREIDLIEEVGRIHGYERIPETLPAGESMQGSDSDQGKFETAVTDVLVACGLQEVVTSTMVPRQESSAQVPVRNPLSDELGCLRSTLIPSLLTVLSYNAGRGTKDLGIFEVGQVFEPSDDGTIVERGSVAGAITGNAWAKSWNIDKTSLQADFFMCKGVVETMLERIGIRDVMFSPASIVGFHPTRGAAIIVAGTQLGKLGEISADRVSEFDLSGRICAFELNLDLLIGATHADKKHVPVSRYPASSRDLAVVVSDGVYYRDVHKVIVEGAGELLESVSLFDLYQGLPLPAGQKSLAFNIVFRSQERTLRDEEVDEHLNLIRKLLAEKLAASFR